MVQGNLKSQKCSLLNQNIQGYLEQRTAMHYNGQKWANFKSHVQGVKWQNQTEQRAFSHLFNGTTKISTSITKSWSEVTSLPQCNISTVCMISSWQWSQRVFYWLYQNVCGNFIHRAFTHESQSNAPACTASHTTHNDCKITLMSLWTWKQTDCSVIQLSK